MARLRILELPAPRDVDGRLLPGDPPFVFVVDRLTEPEAATFAGFASRSGSDMLKGSGARAALVFPAGFSIDLPAVDDLDLM